MPGVDVAPSAFSGLNELLKVRSPVFDLEIACETVDSGYAIRLVSGQPRFDARRMFLGYLGVGRAVSAELGAEWALADDVGHN